MIYERLENQASLKEIIEAINDIRQVLINMRTDIFQLSKRITDLEVKSEKLDQYLKIIYVTEDITLPKYIKKEM